MREQQNIDIEIDTLDKKKILINRAFIEKTFQNAKESLNEYKEFDKDNPRVDTIQLLINEIELRINPRQEHRP